MQRGRDAAGFEVVVDLAGGRMRFYAAECLAGCTWTSHVFFGRPGNNPYCHHRALEMQRNGKRERLEQTSMASGVPFDYAQIELVVEDDPAQEASR